MKKLIASLLSVVLLFAVSAATVSADAKCNGRPGVIFFEHSNYNLNIAGASVTFCGGTPPAFAFSDADLSNNTYKLSFGANWNDRVSSLKVFNWPTGPARIIFYANKNFDGLSISVNPVGDSENLPNLSQYWEYQGGFSDVISSFKVSYS